MIEPVPRRGVWEITWRCDLRCEHCLVDAGPPAKDELDTARALELVDELAELGTRFVTLTGGEPLVRRDWRQIARRVHERSMTLRLSTNGHRVDAEVLAFLEELDCEVLVVSVDGLGCQHEQVRRGTTPRSRRSLPRVLRALDLLRGSPIRSSVITSVTALNLEQLPDIHALLKEHGVQEWQVQLAHRTGRGRAAPFLMPPQSLPRLIELLVGMVDDPVLPPKVHNSIGYLGRNEPLLRPSGRGARNAFWTGCSCGLTSLGIEPDGGIKGCASQVGAPFVVGHVTREPLRVIFEDRPRFHWLKPGPERMSGDCADCAFKGLCGAGCTALAYGSSGELFDNPYCSRRVTT